MKKFYSKVVAALAFAAVCTTTAEATPAFARQMDADCMSCHYQNIPKLNSFGREFKLSGFTMTGGAKEITGKASGGLELPSTLNMAFVIKARYHNVYDKAGVKGSDQSLIEAYDESAFIFGGKIGENFGTSMEFIEGLAGGKLIYSKPFDIGRLGVSVYMTDGLGAFSGLETLSTGLYRPVRQFENRKRANIFQKLGVGAGAAQGAQVYYSGHGFFATVGQYVPVYGASTDTEKGGYKTFARLTYEHDIAGFNVAVGGYYLDGDVRDNNATVVGKVRGIDGDAFDRESAGLDFQLQGDVSNMSLMVTAGWVLKNDYTAGGVIGATQDKDTTGYSIAAQLNPTDTWGVKLAYLSYSDDSVGVVGDINDEDTINVGLEYNVDQNLRLCLEYSDTSYDDPTLANQKDFLFMTQLAF
ncbi:MAG: hypothetical protein KAS26_01955 [Sulfurimonas sp.]|nr:hypothetical protein [Sulfurimonas sp.]